MVLLGIGGIERQLGSASDLDSALAGIGANASEPQLVSLRFVGAVLTIGVGRTDWSVALFLDQSGRPEHGRSPGGQSGSCDVELSFSKDGRTISFYPRAGIRPSEARQAALDFIEAPGVKPAALRWETEGVEHG